MSISFLATMPRVHHYGKRISNPL